VEYLATAHRFHHLLDCHLAECERLPFDLQAKKRTSGRLPDRVLWDEVRPFLGSYVNLVLSSLLVVFVPGGWELPISVTS